MSQIDQIKSLMNKYNQAQQAAREADTLKKQLVPLLKAQNLTDTKFNFTDRSIGYHKYICKEEITQKLIKSVIQQKYPQINPDKFIADLCSARKSRTTETLKATKINTK
jgi:hypothetical protein